MFKGSIVALVTPMLSNGDVDYTQLEALIDFHVREGTDAVVIAGTTGESATLSPREHCELLQRSYEIIGQRMPMIAGTGANSTAEAIELTRCAKESRAEAALLVTPYYNKPTQKGLILHHQAIASAVDIPQILYNVPGRTACDMLADTVAELSRVDNIVGIKEATGSMDRLADIKRQVSDDFALLTGDDSTTCEFILNGGHGAISVTANVVPAKMARMCRLAAEGKAQEARAADAEIADLHRLLFIESNPIPVKWAVSQMGFGELNLRLPMTVLSEEHQPLLRQALVACGAL
ncbi:MAG: 4-hydroxy-tetrahydrodipicolinate synthase [Gammaproteobacteria bacterium]|nr:4-hydroxy-tetrahydrodipicolinate synthase [Gammaproteobacteria bacterium]MDH3537000.1 4-hydroxy-tetrahydrodipicolinate synthase [Gammaproteobacteria bacterium]